MLDATTELATFLNTTTQGVSIPVLTITLRDGTVLRWARWQSDIAFGGVTWLAHGRGGRPTIKGYRFRAPVGLQEKGVGEVSLDCGDSAMLGSKWLLLEASRGAFRGASLLIERLYRATPTSAVVGKLFRFSGTIFSSPVDSHTVSLSVETVVSKLQATTVPKTLLASACQNALFDTACGVSKVANTSTGTVAAGSTRTSVNLTGSWATGHWDQGTITFTSGALAGERRSVRVSTSPGTLAPSTPLPSAPAAGVTVSLTLGCDHTTGAGGCSKFANLTRYRGMLHLPKEG